jgi:hypothetical protein
MFAIEQSNVWVDPAWAKLVGKPLWPFAVSRDFEFADISLIL